MKTVYRKPRMRLLTIEHSVIASTFTQTIRTYDGIETSPADQALYGLRSFPPNPTNTFQYPGREYLWDSTVTPAVVTIFPAVEPPYENQLLGGKPGAIGLTFRTDRGGSNPSTDHGTNFGVHATPSTACFIAVEVNAGAFPAGAVNPDTFVDVIYGPSEQYPGSLLRNPGVPRTNWGGSGATDNVTDAFGPIEVLEGGLILRCHAAAQRGHRFLFFFEDGLGWGNHSIVSMQAWQSWQVPSAVTTVSAPPRVDAQQINTSPSRASTHFAKVNQ